MMMLKEPLNARNTFRENLINHPDLPEDSVIQAIAAYLALPELEVSAFLAFLREFHGQSFDQAEDFIRDWEIVGCFWDAQELEDYINEGQVNFFSVEEFLRESSEFVQLPSGRILSWNY